MILPFYLKYIWTHRFRHFMLAQQRDWPTEFINVGNTHPQGSSFCVRGIYCRIFALQVCHVLLCLPVLLWSIFSPGMLAVPFDTPFVFQRMWLKYFSSQQTLLLLAFSVPVSTPIPLPAHFQQGFPTKTTVTELKGSMNAWRVKELKKWLFCIQ